MVTKLGDILEFKYGKSLPAKLRDNTGYPVYGSNGIVGRHSKPFLENQSIIIGRKGSVGEVHVSTGSCSPIDTTYFIDELFGQPIVFWGLLLKHLGLGKLNKATAIPGLNREDAYRQKIPLPPLPEQKRIATKLDSLLAKVDACKARLDKVSEIIRRFRQSVLAAATSGKLTEDWREENSDSESAEELLRKIRMERRTYWEKEQMEKFKANGKTPNNDRWKTKYKDPSLLNIKGLRKLPKKWTWSSIGEIALSMKNGIYKHSSYYSSEGTPCLRMYNIQDGKIDWIDIKRMVLEDKEIAEYELKPGDILVNRVNSRELVGKAALITSEIEKSVYESKNIRLQIAMNVNSSYVNYWMMLAGNKHFSNNAQQTVGMASINQKQLASLQIPLPGFKEQKEIVHRVEALFSKADQLQEKLNAAKSGVDKLTPTILAKAFRGELVPQDPNDEPAELLLQRIRAEQEAHAAKPKKGRQRRKKRT